MLCVIFGFHHANNENNLKLEGWKAKKKNGVNFLRCPYCGHHFEGISVDRDGMVECYKCRRKFPENKLKQITLERLVAICKVCGTEVPLTPQNLNMIGCCTCPICGNVVAVKFKNHVLRPKTVLKLDWNREIEKRAIKLDGRIFFAICENKKDFLVLKIMQFMARKEGHSFLYIREDEQKAGLIFDIQRKKYIGYIVWTENRYAIARQIFIVKDERSKGYGSMLMKFWVDNFANKVGDKFGVESPNKFGQKILVKLGYAQIEGGSLKGIKCFFVGGC